MNILLLSQNSTHLGVLFPKAFEETSNIFLQILKMIFIDGGFILPQQFSTFFAQTFPDTISFISTNGFGLIILITLAVILIIPRIFQINFFAHEKTAPSCSEEQFFNYKSTIRILMIFNIIISCLSYLICCSLFSLPLFEIDIDTDSTRIFSLFESSWLAVASAQNNAEYSTYFTIRKFFHFAILIGWMFFIMYCILRILSSFTSLFFPKLALKKYYKIYKEDGKIKSQNSARWLLLCFFLPVLLYIVLYSHPIDLSALLYIDVDPLSFITGITPWTIIPFFISLVYLVFCIIAKLIVIKLNDILEFGC